MTRSEPWCSDTQKAVIPPCFRFGGEFNGMLKRVCGSFGVVHRTLVQNTQR